MTLRMCVKVREMKHLLIKGECEDVGRTIYKPLSEFHACLAGFQMFICCLDCRMSTGLRWLYQWVARVSRQGRKRTAEVMCMSNFSSLFRESFFQSLSAALIHSPLQACHSDPKGGTSSLSSPLLTLERTYESQEDRTSSSNS